ncbi:MAG: hypothetical protein ACKO6N_10415 [Myxococcota bacterium]
MSSAANSSLSLSPRALGLLSLCTGLSLFWYGPTPPRLLSPDTIDFLSLAQCLEQQARGLIPTCEGAGHWALGHPLTLALMQQLPLEPITAVRLLSWVPAALLCFPLFWLGRALGGPLAGAFAALLSVSLVPVRLQALLPDARTGALLLIALAYAALVSWLLAPSHPGQHEGGTTRSVRASRGLFVVGLLLGAAVSFRPEAKLNTLMVFSVVCLTELLGWRAAHPSDLPHSSESTTTAGGWLERGWLVFVWHGFRQEWRMRLRTTGRACLELGLGLLSIQLPLQYMVYHLTGRFTWEPRAWEVPIVGWMAYLPLKLFLPLFELGAQARPMRTAVQQHLEQHPETSRGVERLSILVQQLPENLAQLPAHLEAVLSLPLLGLALLGGWTLWHRGRRVALGLWSLWLLPLGLLIFLPQTYNLRMPESNLLFVPVSLSVLAGVGLAWLVQEAQARLERGLHGRLWLGVGLVLSGVLLSAHSDMRERLRTRGDAPFEASLPVQSAAAWLKQSGPVEVLASFGAACVPYLGGQRRLAAPSFWEVPVTVEQFRRASEGVERPRLLALTSVDAADDPLLVREWLRVEPPLEVVFFSEAQGQWVALLKLEGAASAR